MTIEDDLRRNRRENDDGIDTIDLDIALNLVKKFKLDLVARISKTMEDEDAGRGLSELANILEELRK